MIFWIIAGRSLGSEDFINNGFDKFAAGYGAGVANEPKLRGVAKRLVARLPWGIRKFVAFLGNYGPVNLLLSKSSFIGMYRSFADVPQAVPPNNQFLVDAAVLNLRAQKFDDANGLPLLRNSHSLLPLTACILSDCNQIRILDIGGAGGVDFANLLNAAPCLSNIQYRVVDLPDVCELGKRRWQSDQRISFTPQLPNEGEVFDLIFSSWAIQYFDQPLELLEKFTAYEAKAILLVNVPFSGKGAFVRVQVNKMIPSWVLSLPDLKKIMCDRGYRLAFHAAGDVDHNVDNYPPEYRVSNLANLLFLKS